MSHLIANSRVPKKIIGDHFIKSLKEMNALARVVASNIKAGDILLLTGELGSGKTTFTQFLAKELQIEDKITSPTFTMVVEYDVPRSSSLDQFVHIDLYRLTENGARLSKEDLDYFNDMFLTAETHKRIIVVEWASRLGNDLPEDAWHLEFAHSNNIEERIVGISREI